MTTQETLQRARTDHELGVHVDGAAAVHLRAPVVRVLLRRLRRGVLAGERRLPVAEAEEVEVVAGVRLAAQPGVVDGLGDDTVHHFHGAPVPEQDGLHGLTRRHALGPHRRHDVHCEPLAAPDLGGDLERDLDGHQVQAPGVPVLRPRRAPAEEVLVLDVDEPPRAPDGLHVADLYAAVHRDVLAARQPHGGGLGRVGGEPHDRRVVDGPEHLHVPRVVADGVGERRRAQVEQAAAHVLRRLLPPPLLEVGEHVPRRGTFQSAVHVVPRLPRAAAPQGGVLVVVLHEVVEVRRVEVPEQRVVLVVVPARTHLAWLAQLWALLYVAAAAAARATATVCFCRYVPAVAEVYAADEADDVAFVGARRGCVERDGLLVVRELGAGLDVLHHGQRRVGVARAEEAPHVGALEEPTGLLVVRLHQAGVAEERHGRVVLPRHHQHGHPFVGLPLQQLAQRDALGAFGDRRATARVAHQRDLRVHRPPGDVHEPPRVADGGEQVLPQPRRPVRQPAVEADPRVERVGQVRVLVQRDAAVGPLREKRRLDAREFGEADAGAPGRVTLHVKEVQADAEARRVRLVGVLAAAEVEPALQRLSGGDARGGHGPGAEDARADEVLVLDREGDRRGGVGAVQAERLVPGRAGGVELHLPGARHPRRADVDVDVEPAVLEAVHA